MHEMSLMYEILEIVSEDAKKQAFNKIEQIEVVVGELSNVLSDALELAFLYFQEQENNFLINDARLKIIREDARAECKKCELEFKPDFQIALCPNCKNTTGRLIAGEAFRVEAYEGS